MRKRTATAIAVSLIGLLAISCAGQPTDITSPARGPAAR